MSELERIAMPLERRTQISNAFSRGNYANAYESTDLESFDLDAMPEHERIAFVLGFFATYGLGEIGDTDREIFDDAYWSPIGRYVVDLARYCDSRDDDFAMECDTVG